MEIKDEAKARLKALPEDLRREIGYRLHLLQQDLSRNHAVGSWFFMGFIR